MPPGSSVPGLQQKLFQRLGVAEVKGGGGKRGYGPASRKDQRKAQRQDKKSRRYSRPAPASGVAGNSHRVQKPQKSNSIKRKGGHSALTPRSNEDDLEDSEDHEGDEDDGLGQFDGLGGESVSGDDSDDDDVEGMSGLEDDEELDSASDYDDDGDAIARASSKLAKHERLAEDDEIDEYERKLGIKGKKSLPKAFKEDGLDDIMGDLGGDVDSASEEDQSALKRKREDEDWLASKRKKAAKAARAATQEESDISDESIGEDEFDEEDPDLNDVASFGGFSSDEGDAAPVPKKEKENPYVAPNTSNVATKYVPPALRRVAGQDDAAARLRKQVQGQINRLTDDNILSIVQSIRDLYDQNARGAVTEAVTDAMLDQLCKPEALPDQFFVLSGGFCAALYKVIGSSFGSHVINEVVKLFGGVYEKALVFTDAESGIPKEPSNIIAFLTQLYTFEVVNAKIVFDYMERLLQDLNEINVELLLRICRMAGALLRRDDPLTLKHVADELAKAVKKAGPENTSVRTKFMVETISDLRNKKKKARGLDSGVVSEAVQRMKKRLGELKSQNRRLDGLAPMGMSLDDIEGAETKGKWWLVGASVPAREGQYGRPKDKSVQDDHDIDPASDSEDMSIIFPDLTKKARGQSFTTETEIAIFAAVMGASDVKEGYQRFRNLRIKTNDRQQLAKVLVQCAGSEVEYNGYYAQVAKMACADGRIRFALKTRLWGIFRSLGEPLFGEAAEDEEETVDTLRMQDEARLGKVAMFYADLIHDGVLGLDVLKPLDIPTITSWTMKFMNHLVFELLDGCRGKGDKEDTAVARVFGSVKELPLLAAGVGWILRERDPVASRKKLGPKKKERLVRVSEKAQIVLQIVAQE
ncbi:hypothetical protein NLU13_5421 [Sarocladium strictum]|uniref:MI domain-containing protein n=1 Tax=Sarocladium strictum TaxID=5046 RepID=A0AA39L7L7_SARSR|nr:hypothetical protein NLU13_5421 [Sarocladium strictum]